MMTNCEKLPDIISLSDYGGNWENYKEAIYTIFKNDFINNRVMFNGKNVDIIHQAIFDGKERSFWHIISTGHNDESRIPDLTRCARISWIKALIQDDKRCDSYKSWKKFHDQTNKERYYIWCSADNYLVILEDRISYYKLITAFDVKEYNVDRYEREYQAYKAI